MALQRFIDSFFRAVRLRKGTAPSVSDAHAQLYCSDADEIRCVLPTGADVNLATGGGGGAVDSVFTRTGDVVAVAGDYAASEVTNDSGVAGANVDAALDQLDTDKQDVSEKGNANGYAELDATGVVPVAQIPFNGITYKGNWNADTNTPALTSGMGDSGDQYTVSVAGTTNLDGITDWQVGDKAAFNGTLGVWEKQDNTDQVASVFGRQGVVTAAASDYDASQVDNDSGVAGADVAAALDTLDSGKAAAVHASAHYTGGDRITGIRADSGSGVAPTITFNSDTDCGMFNYTANGIGFAGSGAQRYLMNCQSSGRFFGPATDNGADLGQNSARWGELYSRVLNTSLFAKFTEGSDPGNAESGKVNLFAETDGRVHSKDDSGNEFVLGTDGDAIHDNVAGEIAAVTEKATPVAADVVLIEDSADTNNKKRVQIGNIPLPSNALPRTVEVNAQVGTTYTLLASDNGKVVTLNNAAAITVTVPSGLGAGFNCTLVNKGAGQVSVSASGTTINNYSAHTSLAGQDAIGTLFADVADNFYFQGETA